MEGVFSLLYFLFVSCPGMEYLGGGATDRCEILRGGTALFRTCLFPFDSHILWGLQMGVKMFWTVWNLSDTIKL